MTSGHRLLRPLWRGALGAVLLVGLLSACSVVPDYTAPDFPFAARFQKQKAGAPVLLRNDAWWRSFDDPVLVRLVDAALSDNLDLAAARERIVAARANAGTVAPGESAEVSASYTVEDGSGIPPRDGAEVEATFGWLFDPYGGRAARRAAAAARIEVADAELDAARLLLLGSLLRAYAELRFTEDALALRAQERRSRQRSLGLIRELFDAETATRLDLIRARALVAETETLLPGLEAARVARINEIALLTGRTPGSMSLPPGRSGRQLKVPGGAELGVPADLVRNRPDLRIAERLYYAATREIGTARAALYPTLRLSGTISIASFDGDAQNTFGFGPSLTLPALPTGPRKAAVEVAESRARQALITWQSTVLSAVGEVETALAAYQANHHTVAAARRSVRLYEQSVSLTRELILNEGATVQDLLDAERQLATTRVALARAERDLARSFVDLNVALGSGSGEG